MNYIGCSSFRKSKQWRFSFAYSLSPWLLHSSPHFAPNYSINPASIIPSSFTSHYLATQNPIPARPESHFGLQKIYKNVDRIQISVISTFFFHLLFFSLYSFIAFWQHFSRFSHASAVSQNLSHHWASSPGPESPPSAFLMVACKNLQLQLQHAQTAGFNIKMCWAVDPPLFPPSSATTPSLFLCLSHSPVCLPGVRAFCENKQQ